MGEPLSFGSLQRTSNTRGSFVGRIRTSAASGGPRKDERNYKIQQQQQQQQQQQ